MMMVVRCLATAAALFSARLCEFTGLDCQENCRASFDLLRESFDVSELQKSPLGPADGGFPVLFSDSLRVVSGVKCGRKCSAPIRTLVVPRADLAVRPESIRRFAAPVKVVGGHSDAASAALLFPYNGLSHDVPSFAQGVVLVRAGRC